MMSFLLKPNTLAVFSIDTGLLQVNWHQYMHSVMPCTVCILPYVVRMFENATLAIITLFLL